MALNTGTDMNLSYKPIAGGMAGAAYTRVQEPSAAVFGNPATLTQLKGYHFELGASFMQPEVVNRQYSQGYVNRSASVARNYILPDFAFTAEVAPGYVVGAGVAVNAGLGADYRKHPVNAGAGLGLGGAGVGGAATIPLNDELISFGANVAGAAQLTDELSLGAALTVGFGLAQLGSTGNTTGLQGLTGNFGGTTSSVHDISVSGAVGATYKPIDQLSLSTSVKAPLDYHFSRILATTVNGYEQYQNLNLEQPLEVEFGLAGNPTEELLLEADAVWKNWSGANAYKDLFQDQFLALLGAQYSYEGWSFRGGYSYATPLLRDNPSGTIGNFAGIGTLPFNTPVPGVLNYNDLVKVVQTTLVPVVWQHTLTAGLGYRFTESFRVDGFGAYSFEGTVTRNTLALGTYQTNASQWTIGAGVNFTF
ncbi:MAG: outer membrane protein transport protein [Methylotetracoccus sp.]